jgi:hypothetical protein
MHRVGRNHTDTGRHARAEPHATGRARWNETERTRYGQDTIDG